MNPTNFWYTRNTSSASIIEPVFTNWRKGTLPLNHRNQVVLRVRDINKKKSESHLIDFRKKSLWNYGSIECVYCPFVICCWAEMNEIWICQQRPEIHEDPSSASGFPFCCLLHLFKDKKKIIFTTNLSDWDWSDFCIFKEFKSNFGVIATITTWLLKLLRTALHQWQQ